MSINFLYKFHEYITLVKYDPTINRINMPSIQYNTKLYKGVSNNIDFIIQNNDRRPIRLFDYKLQVQIQRADQPSNTMQSSPEVLLKKYCTIIDEQNGKARLTLHNDDIQHWSPGYYRYVVQMVGADDNPEYLYTDVNKNTFGYFQLDEGVVSSIQPAIEINEYQFTPTPVDLYDATIWVTGALAGDAQSGRANGMHSIAVYQENFYGKFWIEGSLSVNSPMHDEWFEVPFTPDGHPHQFDFRNNWFGPTPFNFVMNLYWIRFVYRPDIANTGKFIRVLYKN
jgi:hypothetical protein